MESGNENCLHNVSDKASLLYPMGTIKFAFIVAHHQGELYTRCTRCEFSNLLPLTTIDVSYAGENIE